MQSKSKLPAMFSRSASCLPVVVLFAAYVVFSLTVGGAGILHKEMDIRLPAHISGEPVLQILFDAKAMNIGGWEARQLSYLFDILDGNFVALCIKWGFPHFRSLTHYLFTLIIALYLWSFMTHTLKLDRIVCLLMISLLLTTPSFIYSYYYRTSKIGVTLFLILLLGEAYKILKGKILEPTGFQRLIWLQLTFLFATLSLMLFDILGGFFATVLIAYLLLAYFWHPDKSKLSAITGMIAGYVIWLLYFTWLGPALMLAITGQRADTSYLTGAPIQYVFVFLAAGIPSLVVDMVRYLFGYVSFTLGVIFLAVLLGIAVWLSTRLTKHSPQTSWPKKNIPALRTFIGRNEPVLSLLYLFSGIAIIYALLVTRHPPVLWADVRPTYYIMPAQAALLFGVATLISRTRIRWALRSFGRNYLLRLLVAMLLVGNIVGSIYIKDLLLNGNNTRLYTHNTGLLEALHHIDTPDFEPDPVVASDPIYRLFAQP